MATDPLSRPPVAILGAGCRFPGAEGIDQFWQLLCNEVEAISPVPPERWNPEAVWREHPGLRGFEQCRWGGFVEDGDCFDAEFFGVSAGEAERMDPQQGLVLEAAWQALEHGAIDPNQLRGSQTGVFIGIGNSDFDRRLCRDLRNLDTRAGTGTSYSIVANRLSYVLGLQGPSIAVDLACSSSLCAVHLACQSLWLHECELALAGGVHLMLAPEKTVTFAEGNILAPDGRCRSFSAEANGYVRGEGGGVVVLKLLAAAERDGDPILAVIRGCAVNHNGQSNGLSAPAGGAQRLLVERALRVAGVEPASIGYVEAHSTGTVLGDVIEVNALRKALSTRRASDQLCLLGSVKPNIGHLEAAAGVASLIKAMGAVREAWIPKTLASQPINPRLDLQGSSLFQVVTRSQPWPTAHTVRRAGVSSFSFGGANAHVIIEQPPAMALAEPAPAMCILPLSACSKSALLHLTQRYETYLAGLERVDEPPGRFADACYTASVGRKHFAHRLALLAASPSDARRLLGGLSSPEGEARLMVGTARPRRSFSVIYAVCGESHGAQDSADTTKRISAAVACLSGCGIAPQGLLGVDPPGMSLVDSIRHGAAANWTPGLKLPPETVEYDPATSLVIVFGTPSTRLLRDYPLHVAAGHGDWCDLLNVIGRAYVLGIAVQWQGVHGRRRRLAGLPTYPFQRRRFWNDGPTGPDATGTSGSRTANRLPVAAGAQDEML